MVKSGAAAHWSRDGYCEYRGKKDSPIRSSKSISAHCRASPTPLSSEFRQRLATKNWLPMSWPRALLPGSSWKAIVERVSAAGRFLGSSSSWPSFHSTNAEKSIGLSCPGSISNSF